MMICVVDLVCKLAEDSDPGLIPTLPWLRQLKVYCWVHFEFKSNLSYIGLCLKIHKVVGYDGVCL